MQLVDYIVTGGCLGIIAFMFYGIVIMTIDEERDFRRRKKEKRNDPPR